MLALTGIFGLMILLFDNILRTTAPMHYSALIVFVLIDFVFAGLVVFKPSKMTFTLVVAWAAIRILLQLADVSQAHVYQMRYTEFADYLFSPVSSMAAGNPTGVPGAFIDLIIIIEVIVIWIAWKARSSSSSK